MPDNEVKFVRMILITSLVFHLLWAPRKKAEKYKNFFCFFDARLMIVHPFHNALLYLALNTNFQSALETALGKQAPS
ncbi:hypothetical protein TYRP_017335 [Tyrophagus putrescentiae]|nr:hypothetical protein TYRP_017335 [Tyrophagus putrescentiae]